MSSLREYLNWTKLAGQEKLFLWEALTNFGRLLGISEFLFYWYRQSKSSVWHSPFCPGKELALSRGYLWSSFVCLSLCRRTWWLVCAVVITASALSLWYCQAGEAALISAGMFLCHGTCLADWATCWFSHVQGCMSDASYPQLPASLPSQSSPQPGLSGPASQIELHTYVCRTWRRRMSLGFLSALHWRVSAFKAIFMLTALCKHPVSQRNDTNRTSMGHAKSEISQGISWSGSETDLSLQCLSFEEMWLTQRKRKSMDGRTTLYLGMSFSETFVRCFIVEVRQNQNIHQHQGRSLSFLGEHAK